MAYFEAMEEAVRLNTVFGHKNEATVIQDIFPYLSDKQAQLLSDCAEIADIRKNKNKLSPEQRARYDAAVMVAGEIVIEEIYQYLADNHPTAWGDEGDLGEYEEKLRLDRKERTRDMQIESMKYPQHWRPNER